MISHNFSSFKSGTDIRGVAYDIGEGINLTDEVVKRMAKAYAEIIRCKLNKKDIKIAVGHDSRLSAKRILNAVTEALVEVGVHTVKLSLASTPSMFMILQEEDLAVDASIMLTASHHPMDKNGLKFFTKNGGVESSDISEILKLAEQDSFENTNDGTLEEYDFMPRYSEILREKVIKATGENKPLEGFKIVVDAGNGAGGFYATEVLQPLGADITGSQFLNPDGSFPNHIPNPENPVAMQSISKCVLDNKADLGVIFDTDVDRAAAVGSDGEEINRNKLIALISAILLEETQGATIVTDSITSIGLKKFIESKGGVHHRFKRGYKNVIDEGVRLNNEGKYSPLAIETSGHAALKENFFLDDGAYLVTRLIIQMAKLKKQGKELTDLIADLEMAQEECEIRLGFFDNDFKAYGLTVLEEFEKFVENSKFMSLEKPNFEGVRVNFDEENGNGWLLVRMSLHDPIMPINIESNSQGGCQQIAKVLFDFIKNYAGIDSANLKNFIK